MPNIILEERFTGPGLDQRLSWSGEPAEWSVDARQGRLRVRPTAGTDFWQKTHYGFEADNGHFLHVLAEGDWVLDDPGRVAVACGLYACAPRGEGFVAEFGLLRLERGT